MEKKKLAAAALAVMLSAALVTGCSGGADSSSSTESESSSTIYGVVTSVSSDSVTLEVGTLKEQSKPEESSESESNEGSTSADDASEIDTAAKESSTAADENSAGAGESSTASDKSGTESNSSDQESSETDSDKKGTMPEAPSADSMIEKTGETKTITITSDTKITKQAMGGGQQGGKAPSGDGSSDDNNGTPPEKPSGDGSSNDSNGAPPEMSSEAGSADNNGTPPEKPSGDGEAPSGNNSSNSSESSGESTASDSSESSTESKTSDNSGATTESNSSDRSGATTESNSSDSSGATTESNSSDSNASSEEETLSVSDLKEDDVVSVTLDEDGNASEITLLSGDMPGGNAPGNGGGNGGGAQASAPTSYAAVTKYSKDTDTEDKTYSSTGTDENAIYVADGATVSLKNATISRSSDDSEGGDSSSFYGVGAAVLTTDGTTYISGGEVTTDAAGGAGIFSYGDGTTYVSGTKISTEQDTSGGIHAAGGGKLYAWNVTASTKGESSAAIRSDRGGGTIVADGGTYTTDGTGSPAVYSTADISVNEADLTANNSEAVCIEGLNSLRLFNCNLTGNMKDDSQNDCTWNVILYQSMSGDSEVGNSTFDMEGGTLTAKNGGMFYTTNTESTIRLSDVDITYADENDFFLKCTGNSNERGWGTSGANGADCNFTAENQQMEGDVIWDSISKLDFYMSDGSTLKGAVTDDESNAGDGGDGYCNFYIDEGCTWTVTGDSTLTALYNAGSIVDEDGKTVTVKGTDGTVYVEGDSEYTVTVSSYSEKADMSGMTEAASWSDYEVTKPEEL